MLSPKEAGYPLSGMPVGAFSGSRCCLPNLGAMAKTNRVLPEVFDSLRRAAAANVQAFDAQGLAHTLWALAKTSRALPEICNAVCRAAAGNVQAFNALGLANALWAMATTSQVLSESFDPPHEYGSVEEANVRSASSAGRGRGRAPFSGGGSGEGPVATEGLS